jgi:hypothetical protein
MTKKKVSESKLEIILAYSITMLFPLALMYTVLAFVMFINWEYYPVGWSLLRVGLASGVVLTFVAVCCDAYNGKEKKK